MSLEITLICFGALLLLVGYELGQSKKPARVLPRLGGMTEPEPAAPNRSV